MIGFGIGPIGGGGGVAVRNVNVPVGATGPQVTLVRLLGSASTFSLLSGTNANITLSGGNRLAFTSGLSAGATQTAMVREQVGTGASARAVEYAVNSTGQAIITAPAAPTVTVTPGDGQLSIAWTDNSNGGAPITAHNIYINGALAQNYTGSSPFVVTGLANGVAVTVEVSAINSAGYEGPRSASQNATPTAIAAPGNVASFAVVPGVASAGIIWMPPTTGGTPATYEVWRAPTVGGTMSLVQTINHTGAVSYNWLDTGVANGATPEWQVIVKNGGGSASSAKKSTTPSIAGLPKPHLMIAWYDPADITGFANGAQVTSNWLDKITGIAAAPTGSAKPTFGNSTGQGGMPYVKPNGTNLFTIGSHALLDANTYVSANVNRAISLAAIGRNSTSSEATIGHMWGGETNGKNSPAVCWNVNYRGAFWPGDASGYYRKPGADFGMVGMSCYQTANGGGAGIPGYSTITAIVDGTITNSSTTAPTGTFFANWTIGARSTSSMLTNMEIYGCFAWGTELSRGDWLQFAYYMWTKYGITPPYTGKTYFPIFPGNSIMQGVGVGYTANNSATGGGQYTYPAQLCTKAGRVLGSYQNCGRAGLTWPLIQQAIQGDIYDILQAPWFLASGMIPHIHGHEGYNGNYLPQVFTDMKTYMDLVRAKCAQLGLQVKVTAFTCPDTTNTGRSQAARQALDDAMIADSKANGGPGTVLDAVVPARYDWNPVQAPSGSGNFQGVGVTGQGSNPQVANFADGTHLTGGDSTYPAGGYGALATTAYAILGPGTGTAPTGYGTGASTTDGWNWLS